MRTRCRPRPSPEPVSPSRVAGPPLSRELRFGYVPGRSFRAPRSLMFPKAKSALQPNTYGFESEPLIKPTGFREYDARWLLDKELNLMGVQALGMGLGTLIRQIGVKPEIVTGHDFRAYSTAVKMALVSGLMAAGCKVHDIGLALSPMAYFAQFDLDVPCVAMVTASHNDNGWTGVKMGADRPRTFGPDEIGKLKDIVINARFELAGGGSYGFVRDFAARYIDDLTNRPKLERRLKVVAACVNGTAGAFAPKVLESIGCEVIRFDKKTVPRPITGRPVIPTSNAVSTRSARSPVSRNPGTSSSMRRSAAAMTTASSRRSRCATCSTAIRESRWRS